MQSQMAKPKHQKEVLIPVIGMTGAGRSTFINHLFESDNCPVGTTLDPCTRTFESNSISFDDAMLKPYPTNISTLKDYVFTIVDTPGFEEDGMVNDIILENLLKYLKDKRIALGGIIYLHDITRDRVSPEAGRLLKRLQDRSKEATNAKIVFGTTKGRRLLDKMTLQDKQSQLKDFWTSMIDKGARVLNFEENRLSALEFLECIVNVRQEIFIPVMGMSCAGKSSFINYLLGQEKMRVGHGLTSCSTVIQSVTIFLDTPSLQNYAITMVDTPGFDDTYGSDAFILQTLADWLAKSYRQKKVLGGIIFLHDISSGRFSGAARRNLEMFNDICGDAALRKVVIGTTHWRGVDPENGQLHQNELESAHWLPMIQRGTDVLKFQDSCESAIQFIEVIVSKMKLDTYLAIQSELVDDNKIIPETKAGQELRYTLKEILEAQKKIITEISRGGDQGAWKRFAEATEKIKKLDSQIRELKIPFTRKLGKLFRLLTT